MSCAVFCQTLSGTWYSPRTELAAYHLSSYFPDGMLCHKGDDSDDSDVSYYCQDKLCLPGNLDTVGPNTRVQLVEEGDYTPEDELILDQEGFIVRKMDEEEMDSLKDEEGFIES